MKLSQLMTLAQKAIDIHNFSQGRGGNLSVIVDGVNQSNGKSISSKKLRKWKKRGRKLLILSVRQDLEIKSDRSDQIDEK